MTRASANIAAQTAASDKALAYGAFEACKGVLAYEGSNAQDVDAAARAKADYLHLEIPGNQNPYVPWLASDTEFQCPTCGEIITAKEEHPLHPEDEALLKRYPAGAE